MPLRIVLAGLHPYYCSLAAYDLEKSRTFCEKVTKNLKTHKVRYDKFTEISYTFLQVISDSDHGTSDVK